MKIDEKKEKNTHCVLTWPRCPEVIVLGDCSADICLPAALYCFSQPLSYSEAQHNPDIYITKGPTRVIFYFSLSLPVWCTSWDDGIFMRCH